MEPEKYCLERSCMTLGLGLTRKCNLSCPMCYYRHTLFSSPYNSADKFIIDNINKNLDEVCGEVSSCELELSKLVTILSEIKKVGTILLGLEGEPLCHSEFLKIVEICSHYSDKQIVVTNGLLLSRNHIEQFNRYNVTTVILSCDADNKETYEQLRRGGNFIKFCRNAKLTARLFNGETMIHTVIHSGNTEVVEKMPVLAHNLGITRISLAQLRENSWSEKHGLRRADEVHLVDCLTKMIRNAEYYGIKIIFDNFFAFGEQLINIKNIFSDYSNILLKPFSRCPYPWLFSSILSDGRIFPCCGDIKPFAIDSYNFESVFNSPEHRYLKKVWSGDEELPEVCINCMIGK